SILRDERSEVSSVRRDFDRSREACGRQIGARRRWQLRNAHPGDIACIEALVTDELREQATVAYALEWFDVEASSRRPPHAKVGIRDPDGELLVGSFTGDGPVDAIFHAINAATGADVKLREFRVEAVTGGQDALGETSVVLELGGGDTSTGKPILGSGQGVSTDILEAAARAYVRALSSAMRRRGVAAEAEAATAQAAAQTVRTP
ncbi:MAG: alpha-isopropylmalate synthase regulatory domain-containing protein, partial [Solirubrobacteraceae bacterium]